MTDIVEGLGGIGQTSTKIMFHVVAVFMAVIVVIAVVSLIKAKVDKEGVYEIGMAEFGFFGIFAIFMIGGSWIAMKVQNKVKGLRHLKEPQPY